MFHMVKKGLQWIVNPKMRMYTHIDQQPFVVLTLFLWLPQLYRTEVEEYESSVVYRTLLFHNSCFLKTLGKKSQLTPICFVVL